MVIFSTGRTCLLGFPCFFALQQLDADAIRILDEQIAQTGVHLIYSRDYSDVLSLNFS